MNRRDVTKRFFLAHGCSSHDTEDLTQEVEIRLWQARSRGVEVNYCYWLRTCQTVLDDYLRRLRKERGIFVSLEEAMDSPAPSAEEESRLCLDECLQLLSSEQQEIVRLHIVQGLTFAEIGEALGKNSSTVKKTYRRAIKKLRKYFTLPDSGGGRKQDSVVVGMKDFCGHRPAGVPFCPVRTSLYMGSQQTHCIYLLKGGKMDNLEALAQRVAEIVVQRLEEQRKLEMIAAAVLELLKARPSGELKEEEGTEHEARRAKKGIA